MKKYVLTKGEEGELRALLDEAADRLGFNTLGKESYHPGFAIDRLWLSELEAEDIPAVGFEIERGVPVNERLRKDILNLAWSRAVGVHRAST